MNVIEKITNTFSSISKFIKNTKWWQDLEKENELSNKLLYEDDNVIGCLNVTGKMVLKICLVAIPLALVVGILYKIFTKYVIPVCLIVVFCTYQLLKLKPKEVYMGAIPSDEVWETLAVQVIKPVTKEPIDLMDIDGRFDCMTNSYIFTLVDEVCSDIEIESLRQQINKKFSKWSGIGVDVIRKNKIVSFNGKTVRIKMF